MGTTYMYIEVTKDEYSIIFCYNKTEELRKFLNTTI